MAARRQRAFPQNTMQRAITPGALMLREQPCPYAAQRSSRAETLPQNGLVPAGLMCGTGARSRSEVEESRDGPGEFRGGCRTRRVHYYDEVGMCRHDERVRCVRNRCAQTDYSAITEIILAQVRRIIAVYIRGALDVALAAKSSIDCDRETCVRGTIIPEVVGLIEFGPCKPTARATFAGATTRLTVASEPISLRQIRGCKRTRRNDLIGATGARWHRECDYLIPTHISEIQIELDVRSARERVRCLDLEWGSVNATRVNCQVRIIGATLRNRHPGSGRRQRRCDVPLDCASVVFKR